MLSCQEEDLLITPWVCRSEWDTVCRLVMSNQVCDLDKAERIMSCWKLRARRLPSGVEGTLCLLQGILSWCQNPASRFVALTLSASLSRFLNLMSHIAFNMCGLTKYYDAAVMMGLPEWLVSQRHETSHGEMPQTQDLLRALFLSLQWVRINYWDYHESSEDKDEQQLAARLGRRPASPDHHSDATADRGYSSYKRIYTLLDCYQYLKIYSQWGYQRVDDIASQPQVNSHLLDLWAHLGEVESDPPEDAKRPRKRKKKQSFKTVSMVSSLSIDKALHMVRTQLVRLLADDPDLGQMVVDNLVNEHLMLPSRDFFRSLLSEKEEHVQVWDDKLPTCLLKTWSEIIRALAANGLLPCLLAKLNEVMGVCSKERWRSNLACAWCSEILQSLMFSGSTTDNCKKRDILTLSEVSLKDREKDFLREQLSSLIMLPNEKTVSDKLLPHLLSFINPDASYEDVKELMLIYLGKHSADQPPNPDQPACDTFSVMKHLDHWALADPVVWSSVPLGLCPGQTVGHLSDTFLRSVRDDHSLAVTSVDQLAASVAHEQVTTVDWAHFRGSSNAGGRAAPISSSPRTAAFYRQASGPAI